MKIKNVLLAIMFMSSISCNAHDALTDKIIETTIKAAALCTIYTAYHVYQADGNWNKAKRLMRKTNDQAITIALDIIKKVSQQLEQCKSTPLQKLTDAIAEKVEDAQKENHIPTIGLQHTSMQDKICIVSDNNNKTVYVRK
ncbi:MAG: hypothetical protein Q8Q60_00925 [Candidatus Chromulinivorax sp.]|nr:hypothetical protein [Candidatus Chromulinivorax sp.]